MSLPLRFIDVDSFPGDDFASRWKLYLDCIYHVYLKSVVKEVQQGSLIFNKKPVRCQFKPETNGKHFAFWHMMQEGSNGRGEEQRTPDMERCRRVEWIALVIKHAGINSDIRVFKQSSRSGEISWALWLYERDYVVILWERKDYFLLKTAFIVLNNKREELERDWQAFQAKNG